MERSTNIVRRNIRFSEAAVDGLFAGALAGLAMAVYLVVSALLRGEGPVAFFLRFVPAPSSGPLSGLLMHLAVSGVYGLLFGILLALVAQVRSLKWFVRHAILTGFIYGAFLFVAAWYILLPASSSALLELPLIDLGLAHLLYGAVLGYLVRRIGSSAAG